MKKLLVTLDVNYNKNITNYLVSRNIAKYGLKVKTVIHDMFASYPKDGHPLFFIHQYSITEQEKLKYLRQWDNHIKTETHQHQQKSIKYQ